MLDSINLVGYRTSQEFLTSESIDVMLHLQILTSCLVHMCNDKITLQSHVLLAFFELASNTILKYFCDNYLQNS